MYRVSIELYKREWKFGRTRNVVGSVTMVSFTVFTEIIANFVFPSGSFFEKE